LNFDRNGLRSRTRGPPPFSSINSTPAASYSSHGDYSGRRVRDNRLNFVELPTDLALGDFYIVTVLEIHP